MRRVAALVVCTFGLAIPAQGEDWNQWRGPNRTGAVEDSPALISELPPTGLSPLWMSEPIASANNGGWGSPVVANGRVYLFAHARTRNSTGEIPPRKFPSLPEDKRGHLTPDQYAEYEVNRRAEDERLGGLYRFDEIIYCLDAGTGKTIWKNEEPSVYTRFVQSGSPTVIDGRIYILGAARRARCIDAETGKSLWSTRLPGEFRDEYMMSSFAVADGVAMVLAGYLVGLDTQTGELLWKGDEQKTRGMHSSPVVWRQHDQSFAIVNVANKDTICIEPRTGREAWRVETQATQSTPVVIGDRLLTYGSSRKGGLKCYTLSPAGAELLWTYQRASDKGSSPVVVGDHVYVQGERRLACVDLETGKEAWNSLLDLQTPQYTSLVAADGKVFYALDGLLCFAATPEDFQPLIAAKLNKVGLMNTEAALRRELGLDELEKTEGGLEQSMKIYQRDIVNQGPLPCASPALTDGKLFLRLRRGIACYDIRAGQTANSAERGS